MAFEVKVDATKVRLKLEAMPDKLRSELRSVADTLANELLSDVQQRTPVKTGLLRSSFQRHVRSSEKGVSGTVDIDKSVQGQRGIGEIIEYGAHVPAHEIMPKVKQAMKFMGTAGDVFAAIVHHPATDIAAHSMLRDALAEMEPEIVTQLESAVSNAVE